LHGQTGIVLALRSVNASILLPQVVSSRGGTFVQHAMESVSWQITQCVQIAGTGSSVWMRGARWAQSR
jgi:hypothetical protein